MISSSSTVYKLSTDEYEIMGVVEDSESNSEYTEEILVTIQNNLVDIHTVGVYILLSLGMLIGVGVILCWKR